MPRSCKEVIDNAGADGCFGECSWALSDKTVERNVISVMATGQRKYKLKNALKEAGEKHGDAGVATTARLSVVAAAVIAAVVFSLCV